jgi:hypothetical protein
MATISEIVDSALENYHKVYTSEGNTAEKKKAYWDEVASELLRTPVTDYMKDTYALGKLSNQLAYTSGAASAHKEMKKLRLSMLVDWFQKEKKVALEHGQRTVGMGRAALDINHVVRDAGPEAKNWVDGDQYNQILDMALQGYLDLGYLHNLKQDAYDRLVNNSKDPEQPPISAQVVSDFFDSYAKKVHYLSSDPFTPEKLNDLKSVLLKMEDRAPDYGANYDDLYAAQGLFRSFPNLPKDLAETRTALSRLIVEAGLDFPFRTLRILTKFRPDDVFDYLADPKRQGKHDHHLIGALQNAVPNEKLKDLLTTHLQNVSPDNAKHIGDVHRQFLVSMNNPITIDDKMVGLAKDIFEKHNIDVLGAGNFVSGKEGRDWESFRNDKLVSNYLKNPIDDNFKALGKGLSKRFGTAIDPSSLSAIADNVLENVSTEGAIGATSYIQAINTVDKRFGPTLLNKLLDKNHTHYTNSQKGVQTITPERKATMALMLSSMVGAHFGNEGIYNQLPMDGSSLFDKRDFDGKSAASSDTDYEDSLRDLVGHLKATGNSKSDPIDSHIYKLLHERLVNSIGHDLGHSYAAAAGKLVMPNNNQAHEVDPQYGNSIGVMQVQPQTSGLRAIRTMLNDRGALSVKDVSAKLNPFRRVEQNETMVPDWDQFVDSDGNVSIDKLEAHKERIAGTPQARSAIPKIDKVIQHIKNTPKLEEHIASEIQRMLDQDKEDLQWVDPKSQDEKALLYSIEQRERQLNPHTVEQLPADLRNGFPVKKKVVTENKLIDWSPVSVGGNIHPDKLEEAITKSPVANVGFHTGRFVLGMQQHDREDQNVLTLDVTPEQIKKLKDEGLFEDYSLMASDLPTGLHPQNKYGLGWIRWNEHSENPADPKQPLHIHIDEVQSDWDDKFKEHIESHGEQDAPKVKRIREILFHGHEPGELIHETFQQHIRNNHDVENKPVVWAVWDKDSKKKMRICGLDTSRLPPVDWHTNYQEHPIAMGGKKTKYSDYAYVLPKGTTKVTGPDGAPLIMLPDDYQGNPNIQTSQQNRDLQGEPMYEGLVHKFEEFIQFFDKLQKEEPASGRSSRIEQLVGPLLDERGNPTLTTVAPNSPYIGQEMQKYQSLIDELPHIQSNDIDVDDDIKRVLSATKSVARFSTLRVANTKSSESEIEEARVLKENLATAAMKYCLNHLNIPNRRNRNALMEAIKTAYQHMGFTGFADDALYNRVLRDALVYNQNRDEVLYNSGKVMEQLFFQKMEEIANNPDEPPIPLDALQLVYRRYVDDYRSGSESKYLDLLKKVMPRTENVPSERTGSALKTLRAVRDVVTAPQKLEEYRKAIGADIEKTSDFEKTFIASTAAAVDKVGLYENESDSLYNILNHQFPDKFCEAMLTSHLAPTHAPSIVMRVNGEDANKVLPIVSKVIQMKDLSPDDRKAMVSRVGDLCGSHLDSINDPSVARLLLDHYKRTGEDVISNANLDDSDMAKEYYEFKKDRLIRQFSELPSQETARELRTVEIPKWHMDEDETEEAQLKLDKKLEETFASLAEKKPNHDEFNSLLDRADRNYLKHALIYRAIEQKDHDLLDLVSNYAYSTSDAKRILGSAPYGSGEEDNKPMLDRDLDDHVAQFVKEKGERFGSIPPPPDTDYEAGLRWRDRRRQHDKSMMILGTYLSGKGKAVLPTSNRAHEVLPEFEAGIKEMDVQPQSSGLRAIRTKLKEMGGKLLSIKDVSAKLNPFRRVEEKESMVDDWTPFENQDGTLSLEKLQNYREYVATTPQARSVVPKLDKLIGHINDIPVRSRRERELALEQFEAHIEKLKADPRFQALSEQQQTTMLYNAQNPIDNVKEELAKLPEGVKTSDLPPQLKSSPVKKKVVNTNTVVDWNPISHSGNIHPQKLEDAIGQSPAFKVGFHFGNFTLGAQQHRNGHQHVMTLDVTPDQIKKIKEEGLFELYTTLSKMLPSSMHPQNQYGLGWVRWTQVGDAASDSPAPVHMHLDEVQSDWDDTPANIARDHGYEPIKADKRHSFHTMNDEDKKKASEKTQKLIEDYGKIRKILFHGMEPAQLIHEALQQHVRNVFDVEKKPILWSVWSKKSKKKMRISSLDPTRDPPADWNVAYNQHPFAMGGQDETYASFVNREYPNVPADTKTSQTNADLQGEPTIGGKVHKSEGLDREEIKLGVKTEMEHTKNPKEALKIALDHLNEDPRYYSKAKECGLIKFDMFLR